MNGEPSQETVSRYYFEKENHGVLVSLLMSITRGNQDQDPRPTLVLSFSLFLLSFFSFFRLWFPIVLRPPCLSFFHSFL